MKTTETLWQQIRSDERDDETPSAQTQLDAALKRVARLNYTRGVFDALARFEALSTIVPASVTKEQLIKLIGEAVQLGIAKWEETL